MTPSCPHCAVRDGAGYGHTSATTATICEIQNQALPCGHPKLDPWTTISNTTIVNNTTTVSNRYAQLTFTGTWYEMICSLYRSLLLDPDSGNHRHTHQPACNATTGSVYTTPKASSTPMPPHIHPPITSPYTGQTCTPRMAYNAMYPVHTLCVCTMS